jgi:SAM-dependent methyltransferase
VTRIDGANSSAWSRWARRSYEGRSGWTDPGERAAIDFIRPEAAGRPILDLGVGAGRTTEFLIPISDDYTAVDYTPQMVALTRQRFPGRSVLAGDARDLSMFEADRFSLVVFSFNGIDAVDHEDRARVLTEVARVLRPGGVFLYSTHNMDGPPIGSPIDLSRLKTANPARLAKRTINMAKSSLNHRRLRALEVECGNYAIRNDMAHNFGIVVHFITLQSALDELRAAGFDDAVTAFASDDGRRLEPGDDTSGAYWFHLVARMPSSA